ncbi:hypothetical protein CSP5_0072 [Cuniculiplasma divulgatum]|jgi:hypothetical protein|uniref:Uncharacterized protein n=1 Tax=Cuniculiplasma divulgatum TaxID=1673428 RepID=A0A1N5S4A7_9ARCH|nr:hypothetical protein CSP5_0072 [Cuniculiplasma divulgatum]
MPFYQLYFSIDKESDGLQYSKALKVFKNHYLELILLINASNTTNGESSKVISIAVLISPSGS